MTPGPGSYTLPAVGQEGQTLLKMHGDRWAAELQVLRAMSRQHQIFMASTLVCALFGTQGLMLHCSAHAAWKLQYVQNINFLGNEKKHVFRTC